MVHDYKRVEKCFGQSFLEYVESSFLIKVEERIQSAYRLDTHRFLCHYVQAVLLQRLLLKELTYRVDILI